MDNGMIDVEMSAEHIRHSKDREMATRRLLLVLAQVWEDSHEHCDGIGCKNPYREEDHT